jgi:predicted flavoprotein YhiN
LSVVVVGAGAAGLTAAVRAAEAGARVTLLNAHPKIGLKILMSGGTRCNVTHREVSEQDFNGGSRHVIARILREFTPNQTRAWFESLGVALKLEETGKLFPVTDDAHAVLDALLGACERAGVAVERGARVVRIERAGEGAAAARAGVPRWRIGIQRVSDSAAFGDGVAAVGATSWPLPARAPEEWIAADAVVLATGGLSFPRTGSDGTGYALAASLGHTIVPPVPALTPLAAGDPLCARLQGLTLEAELTLRVAGRRAAATRGSFLFAHFGYSGPAALDLSRHWHRAEGERAVTASFLPGESAESLREAWLSAARDAHLTVRKHLDVRLPDRLVVALCEDCGVAPATALGQVERARREALLGLVTARALPVTGTLGYEKAEVTAGGVLLSEVDPTTLESRKAPGVFLCGEILDVEGRLGGFNFQWAWSSGTVAGRSAAVEKTP